MHRHLHDNLRNVTIPALDKDLEENNYNRDSIERFISIVAGWLTGHIMIEDLAIAGKSRSKWSGSDPSEYVNVISEDLIGFLKTVFSLDAELYNGHYEGEPLKKVSCYEMTFKSENGNSSPVLTLFIEESTLLYLIGKMICISLAKADKNAFQSYIQLSQKYVFRF